MNTKTNINVIFFTVLAFKQFPNSQSSTGYNEKFRSRIAN